MTQATVSFSYLALLRGINVGGKNKLAMKDLAAMFTDAGSSEVQTYIQSGNILFNASRVVVRKIPERIAESIAGRIGCHIPVVLRTREELGEAIRNNPFLAQSAHANTLHAYFLATLPARGSIASLDPSRSLPDTFAAHGREIYLQLPNGMAQTKLTNAYFDSRLSTVSTARNWNTVLKLYELMCGPDAGAELRMTHSSRHLA